MEGPWSPTNVAESFVRDQAKWGKSVIYFLTIADAQECNRLLQSMGVRSEVITGNSPRDEILDAFEKDELDVLVNVAVLTEGFDCPSLKSVFIRPSSKGPTVQMGGRAFRKHPDTPVVNVVQNNDTKYPFSKHATPLNQFKWTDNQWLSIDPKNLKPILRRQVEKLIKAKIELPKFLLNQKKENIFGNEDD